MRGMHRLVTALRRLALGMGALLLLTLLAGGGVALATQSPDAPPHRGDTLPAPLHPATQILSVEPDAPSDQRIQLKTCTAPVKPGDSPEARLTSLAGFDCTTRPPVMGPGSYWLRLMPDDPALRFDTLPASLSVLSFTPGWQQNGAIFVRHRDGSISQMALGNHTLSRQTHIGARVQLRLRTRTMHPDAILLRIDEAGIANGLAFKPTLRTEVSSNRQEMVETAIYCTFAGLCLALLVFNLALLGSMREGFQVTYCLMVISMLIYAWARSGGWSLWLPDRDITDRFRLVSISQGLTAALALRFFIDFLEPAMVPGWLRRLATVTRLGLLATSAAMVVTPLPQISTVQKVIVILFALVHIQSIVISIIAMWRGCRVAHPLMLTWMVAMLAGVLRLAEAHHMLAPNLLTDHSPLITQGIDALLYALAIAMRVKILAEERDHARNEERLARRLADIDPLTGLLNRRGLLAQAAQDGARGPLRLLIVDVDHFKAINDSHGHDRGDDVLRELAHVLTRRSARRGRVARLGGEEFAVIGPAGDLSPALALAILADVRQYRFPVGISVTVSIGMAEGEIRPGTQGDADWSALYRRADTALYEAKTTGRNRVVDAAMVESAPAEQPQHIAI